MRSKFFVLIGIGLIAFFVCVIDSFHLQSPSHAVTSSRKCDVQMKWSIGKRQGMMMPMGGPGGKMLPDIKVVGTDGEIYYHPTKVARLTGANGLTLFMYNFVLYILRL